MNIEQLKRDVRMPKHIAFIVDGNGRWAKNRGLLRMQGHKAGFQRLKELIAFVKELGIKNLSLYCFSTENWNRPKEEVKYLMQLFYSAMEQLEEKQLNARIMISGDLTDERIPTNLRLKAENLIEQTKNNTEFILNLCINYGGRQEILRAVNTIVSSGATKVNQEEFERYLYTADLLPLDFIIRTSGEQRSSNFMPWQSTYSEWYYPKKYFPSFTKKDLIKALKIYINRNRRFGAIKG